MNDVKIPSPTKSHLIAKAPMIGVIMKGKRDINITGPFKDCVRLFTVIAINKPSEITRGRVIRQKVNVNLKAFQKVIFSNSFSERLNTAFLNFSICKMFL
jgi:hypothetical protein